NKTNDTYTRLLNDGEKIEDPIFDVLLERQQRFQQAREIMLDGKQTGFVFVLNPERLPIIETKHAIDMLDQYHLHVETLIVNRVLPEGEGGSFFHKRTRYEEDDKHLIFIPYFPHDITTKEQLALFSTYLNGKDEAK